MYERYALSAAASLNLIQRLNVINEQLFVHAVIRASPLEKNILRQGDCNLKIMGKKRAKEHYDFIKEQYYKEIDNSITNTTIHACESIGARIPQYQNNYRVMPEDSVSCLFSLESKDNVAVLNFASYKKPGGLYFQGVESQEESLCLESTLLPVIEAFKPTYYAWNNKHLNRGMYLDRAFILFEREKQKIYAGQN